MKRSFGFALILSILLSMLPNAARAHCDTMDGPVVKAAEQALETGNINLVLLWVQPQDEMEIRTAFQKTLAVRNAGPVAKSLADRFFFETVVRIHRAGEGAPYSGLKPAGSPVEPGIAVGDEALHHGSPEGVIKILNTKLAEGVMTRFEDAVLTKTFDATDVLAGRRHVRAYVEFIHYVERLYNTILASGEHETPAQGHVH